MTDNDALMERAETQGHLRRILQVTQALGYMVWIGTTGLSQFEVFKPHAATLKVIGIISMPIWIISLVGTLLAMAHVRRTGLAAIMDDERTRGMSTKAFVAGYWVLLVGAAAVWQISIYNPIDVRAIAPILVSLGVAVPSLTYAWLTRS